VQAEPAPRHLLTSAYICLHVITYDYI
jgi:hypothetical protein